MLSFAMIGVPSVQVRTGRPGVWGGSGEPVGSGRFVSLLLAKGVDGARRLGGGRGEQYAAWWATPSSAGK